MKKIFLLLTACYFLQPANSQSNDKRTSLTVTVQEGIELLSVVQYLGNQLGNSTPSPYKQELKTYFLPYRNHAAVTTMFMFAPTIYPDLTELGLLFYDFPNIKMRPLPDSSSWYRFIPHKELEHYLQLCMKFYKDTRFHSFYTGHQSSYSTWADGLKKNMQEPVELFSAHFAGTQPLNWMICLDPLNDWGAHTIVPGKLSDSMQNHVVYQVGYFGDKNAEGQMVFKMNVYDFTWHEGAHAISDAILKNYRAQIDSLSPLLKNDAALKKQNISDWPHYFDELIARSVSIALHKQYRSPAEYEKLLQMETTRGFIHARDVSDVIYNDFIHEKKAASFSGVFPAIFKMLRERYSNPQTQKDALLEKADSYYQAKDYINAAKYADQFYAIDSTCDGCTYNAACFHALAGHTEQAIIYLRKSLELGYASLYLERDDDLKSLHQHSEWETLRKISADSYKKGMIERAKRDKAKKETYIKWQQDWEKRFYVNLSKTDTAGNARQVYQQLQQFNQYKQPETINRYLFLYQTINDSTRAPYMVLLPQQYDPNQSYPLLVVLHGAVRSQTYMPSYADSSMTRFFHRHFTKYATEANMIMVIPYSNRQYNWMYPDSGFSVTPSAIRYLKQFLNIDDNAIYVTGHSNGATGSFSYLLKQPGLFAGFSGMNTQPVIRTGGTFLPNASNRSFYNIATTKDYYFPPAANDSMDRMTQQLGINWTTDMHKDYPHWFPQFDTADIAVKKMFSSILARKRNPFHTSLYWECDDIKYGSCDWIAITKLDTLQARAPWHHQYNFTIPYWINNENPDRIIDSSSIAFRFPRRSGAVKARYSNNAYHIESSRVKTFRIFLSPEMIDFSKPVVVYLNGKKVVEKKMDFNKDFTLKNFSKNFDRKAIWVNYIDVNYPVN